MFNALLLYVFSTFIRSQKIEPKKMN
ncbi:MAG: hypothetical protein ACI9HJ_001734, partial [Ulvibacter sp.]